MELPWSQWLVGAVVLSAGCGPALGGETDSGTDSGGETETRGTDSTAGTDTAPTQTSFGTGDPPGPEQISISVNRDVDILFVIDDSGTMGSEQSRIANAMQSFIDVLEAPDVNANYRIAFTTTDNGNMWCTGGSTSDPEAGRFELSSCLSRLDGFFFTGTDTDASYACTDNCALDQLEILPTSTLADPEARSRPWLERIEGESNVGGGASMADAARCAAPMGISGCGFESPLESMWKALRLSQEESQNQFDFMRDGAVLSIVFLTDEADCSFNAAQEDEVFGQDGPRTFWSLPDEQLSPSSAVCWNAGVSCSPSEAATYDGCEIVDLDPFGEVVSADLANEAAALWPVDKYIEFVQEIEFAKKQLNPNQEVLVSAIVGVPQAYPDEAIVYQQGPDASNPTSFQARNGIAQGCTSVDADGALSEAVPPVRLKAFADWFAVGDGNTNLHSVCNDNYGPALAATAEALRDQLRPACMPACVADTDPMTTLVDPGCTVTETSRGPDGSLQESTVPQCDGGDALPAGAVVCWVPLIDPDGNATPGADDNMSAYCANEGWNLEFRLVRAPGVPAPSGASIQAACELSQNKTIDCPGLP